MQSSAFVNEWTTTLGLVICCLVAPQGIFISLFFVKFKRTEAGGMRHQRSLQR